MRAKVAILDDYPTYAEMVGNYLHQHGHPVMTDVIPFDTDALEAFDPDVIIISLVRKIEALGSSITDFYREVDGGKALQQLQSHPVLGHVPMILTAIALSERELPIELRYDAFVEFPRQIDFLLRMIERLSENPEAPVD